MTTATTQKRSRKAVPPSADDPLVSLPELLAELGTAEKALSRRTFYEWMAKGRAPVGFKLPNDEWRFRRSVIDSWRAGLGDTLA